MVGMSGGVDSAIAAVCLIERGFRVSGLFMKNWEEDDTADQCTAAEDLADAQSVCQTLGIPLYTVNFSDEYWNRVFARFLDEYRAGRTPNPDVLCNRDIKFKSFLARAQSLGADYIATGHYAGIESHRDEWSLVRGSDRNKDQSYFLYMLNQHALSKSLFPLAELHKPDVRQLAAKLGLRVHNKKDSTGICFIGERRFKNFLSRYLPPRPGNIVNLDNCVIGHHDGLMYYTIGQRQGLGIGGPGGPWYVADKDPTTNRLIVVQGRDHPSLLSTRLTASSLHWVRGSAPGTPYRCSAKTRYSSSDEPCVIERIAAGTATVRFTAPQRAVTPGQSVVFYRGRRCLGGGTITAAGAPARGTAAGNAA